MHKTGEQLNLSIGDLRRSPCRYDRVDLALAHGRLGKPHVWVETLAKRGALHERGYSTNSKKTD